MKTDTDVEQFGVHYMLDGYGADEALLKDRDILSGILKNIPTEMGMHAICEPVLVEVGEKNRKDPGGLSGFVLIAESHISFHTFPNRGFVTIDVYTCQNDLDTDALTKKFTEAFKLQTVEEFVKPRGTKYPAKNIY
jgi:S-adenosylmethionine decarboxylase